MAGETSGVGGATGASGRHGTGGPLIGISAYCEQARWGVWERQAVVLPRRYADSVAAAGGVPVLLPPAPGIEDAPARLDGLLLPGGGGLGPAPYGAGPPPPGARRHGVGRGRHHRGLGDRRRRLVPGGRPVAPRGRG